MRLGMWLGMRSDMCLDKCLGGEISMMTVINAMLTDGGQKQNEMLPASWEKDYEFYRHVSYGLRSYGYDYAFYRHVRYGKCSYGLRSYDHDQAFSRHARRLCLTYFWEDIDQRFVCGRYWQRWQRQW